MHEHERVPAHEAVPARAQAPRRPAAMPPDVEHVLALQRMFGNAVARGLFGTAARLGGPSSTRLGARALGAGSGVASGRASGPPSGARPFGTADDRRSSDAPRLSDTAARPLTGRENALNSPLLPPHHYVKLFNMGSYPRTAFATIEVVVAIFKARFLRTRLGPPGSVAVLFGGNPVRVASEVKTGDRIVITLETLESHVLKGTAQHTFWFEPDGPDRVKVFWEAEGRGPAEGETAQQLALQRFGAWVAFDQMQYWTFKSNLEAHAAKAADPGHT